MIPRPIVARFLLRLLLAVLSGLLLSFGYPPFSLYAVALLAFVPLLLALCGSKTLSEAFWIGLFCGISAIGASYFWISSYGQFARFWGFIFFAVVTLYHSLFFAGLGLIFFWLKKRCNPSTALLCAPLLWVLLEYLASFGFLGLVELTGHTQLFNPLLRDGAPLLGVNYLTFLVVLFNSLLVLTLLDWRTRRLKLAALFLLFAAVLTANHLLNARQVKRLAASAADPVPITVVQPPLDPLWTTVDPDGGEKVLSSFLEETGRLLSSMSPHQLLIWPEMVFPYAVNKDGPARKKIFDAIDGYPVELLMGGPENDPSSTYYNTAFLFSGGKIKDLYQKEKLFPFGEYIPWRPFLQSIKKYLPLKLRETEYLTGIRTDPINSRHAKLGMSICLESLFGDLVRRRVGRGAEVLVNLTNDTWFLNSSAAEKHFFVSAMRALENGRYFIQAATVGVSGVIDPQGRIVSNTGPVGNRSFQTTIYGIRAKTWYTRIGLWRFPILALLTLLPLLVYRLGLKREQNVYPVHTKPHDL